MQTKLIHSYCIIGLLLILFSCNTASTSQTASFQNIKVEKLADMSASQNAVLLDVRTPEEVAAGKIDNAQHLDFYADSFQEDLKKLNKNQAYIVYCKSGGRSAKTAKMMQDLGFKEVYNLEGGYTAWNKQR